MKIISIITEAQQQLTKAEHVRIENKTEVIESRNLFSAIKQHENDFKVPWNWIAKNTFSLFEKYPSGISEAILLSQLQVQWEETDAQNNTSQKYTSLNTICDRESVVRSALLEVRVMDIRQITNNNNRTHLISLADARGMSVKLDGYLHNRFWNITQTGSTSNNDLSLGNNSVMILTGCKVMTALGSIPSQLLSNAALNNNNNSTRHNLLRLLPTDCAVIVLENTHPLSVAVEKKNLQGLSFHKPVVSILECGSQLQTPKATELPFVVVGRIVRIGDVIGLPTSTQFGGHFQKQHITLRDISSQEINSQNVEGGISQTTPPSQAKGILDFVIYDDHVLLASILQKGDYVAILGPQTLPQEKERPCVQYGPSTIVYKLKPMTSTAVSPIKKTTQVPCTEDGYFDYRNYPEQIKIVDLHHKMCNVSICGRVVSILLNQRTKNEEGKICDKFQLKLSDTSSQIDIMLWDDFGRKYCNLKGGQFVFISNISTSTSKNVKCFGNCSTALGSSITIISSLQGILNSPFACEIDSIFTVLKKPKSKTQWISRATIVSISQPRMYDTHSHCQRTAVDKKGKLYCPFCYGDGGDVLPKEEASKIFGVVYIIDDGTYRLHCSALPCVHESLLQVAAMDYAKLSLDVSSHKLEQVLNQEYLFWISKTSHALERTDYRIEQAVPFNPSQASHQLLEELVTRKRKHE